MIPKDLILETDRSTAGPFSDGVGREVTRTETVRREKVSQAAQIHGYQYNYGHAKLEL